MAELKMVEIVNGLLDMDQAASYLGIKKDTLYSMVMRKKITYVKVGKLNKFRLQDLEAFIDRNRTEAV